MQNIERIPINIWDDYYDDGYVPEGERQEIHAYVEDINIPHEIRKTCLEKLLNYMKTNLDLSGANMNLVFYDSKLKYPELANNPDAQWCMYQRWEIRIENLTHARRYILVEELNSAGFEFEGIPFEIYSES